MLPIARSMARGQGRASIDIDTNMTPSTGLLDQKGEGVSHNHDGSPKDTDDNSSSKDKKRLSERIKAKFHKH